MDGETEGRPVHSSRHQRHTVWRSAHRWAYNRRLYV